MPAVAAIDVGSNAIRISIVTPQADGVMSDVLHQRFSLRLGADVFADGTLHPDTVTQLGQIFIEIAALLQQQRVTHYRAVATSAMREARNKDAVVTHLKRLSGLHLEVISGEEESALSRQALLRAVGPLPDDALLIDLGGGSLELERARAHSQGQSLRLGTVRLLERYPELRGPLDLSRLAAIHTAIADDLCQAVKSDLTPASIGVGTGGNFDALAHIIPHTHLAHAIRGIDTSRLGEIAQLLAPLTTTERGARYHLRADRSDLLLPAVLVTHALTDLYQLTSLLVPGTGLRTALLYNLANPSAPRS